MNASHNVGQQTFGQQTSGPRTSTRPPVSESRPTNLGGADPSTPHASGAPSPTTAAAEAGAATTTTNPTTNPTTDQAAATLYGAPTASRPRRRSRTTVRDIAAAKNHGEKWAMLTAYDATTAAIFDEAEVPVLLVGDSAANVIYGYDTTVPITVDELLPLVRAVVRGAPHAMVIADLPFGSYQGGPAQALATATRFLKEGGAHAVKLEGGARMAAVVETLVGAGIPVMGHLGLTPQSIHTIGGYRVQGRDEAGEVLLADALAIEAAGAFAVVLEVVPADLAARVTKELHIATVGIGAGADCDAQVLVWQDMAGLSGGHTPRFVKQYADLRTVLGDAARAFRTEVAGGVYPTIEHSY